MFTLDMKFTSHRLLVIFLYYINVFILFNIFLILFLYVCSVLFFEYVGFRLIKTNFQFINLIFLNNFIHV